MIGRPEYTEIEHTADVGLELVAPDLRSALESAAAAMFDVMCDVDTVEPRTTERVSISAREGDLENLLVRWLAELIYLSRTRHLLFSKFDVREIAGGELLADVAGEEFDPGRHAMLTDIKAPTYHQLRIEERGGSWSVRVIFDV